MVAPNPYTLSVLVDVVESLLQLVIMFLQYVHDLAAAVEFSVDEGELASEAIDYKCMDKWHQHFPYYLTFSAQLPRHSSPLKAQKLLGIEWTPSR